MPLAPLFERAGDEDSRLVLGAPSFKLAQCSEQYGVPFKQPYLERDPRCHGHARVDRAGQPVLGGHGHLWPASDS